jgi:hypothetical protein
MSSAAERVFGIPEMLDQILEDVNHTDVFIFQRINKASRQNILDTPRLKQRLLSRIPIEPKTNQDAPDEILVDMDSLFTCRSFKSFLFLEPFVFLHCSVVTRPWEKQPILELAYSYTPRNAPARLLSSMDRAYHNTGSIAMRRGNKAYEVSPLWAKVWLPNAPVRVCLQIYRDEHKYTYTEATQLEEGKAEMRSVAMALHSLASENERKWFSNKTVGGNRL